MRILPIAAAAAMACAPAIAPAQTMTPPDNGITSGSSMGADNGMAPATGMHATPGQSGSASSGRHRTGHAKHRPAGDSAGQMHDTTTDSDASNGTMPSGKTPR